MLDQLGEHNGVSTGEPPFITWDEPPKMLLSLLLTMWRFFIMYEDRKAHALTTWHQLLEHPEIRMSAPEQYDELLRLAEEYCEEGFITREDRRRMIEKATANYRRAVEGLGQGN